MKEVVDLIELITGKLDKFASSNVVVGEPIELGPVTVVPLSRVSIGFGGGGGTGEGDAPAGRRGKERRAKGKGTGSGGGGGARVRPVGAAVFTQSGVEVVPIPDRKGILDTIFDKVPELVDKVKAATERAGSKKGAKKDKEAGGKG